MQKSLLNITVLIVLMFGTIMVVTAQRTSKAVEEALDSIVALEIEDAQGRRMPRGLGFFVSRNQVATHLPNITGFAKIYVKPVGQRRWFAVENISVRDRMHDLALLEVSIPGMQSLSLSDKVQYRGPVYTVSTPSRPKVVKGIIKGNARNGKYIRMSNPISRKNRGGPVLNNKGEVIGVSMLLSNLSGDFRYQDDSTSITITGRGSSINIGGTFAVTSKVLATLLPNTEGESSDRWRQNEKTDKWIPPSTESPNRIEKTYAVNPGGRLTIDTELGEIDVQTTVRDRVEVVVTKEAKRPSDILVQEALADFKVTFDRRASGVYIQGKFGRGRNYWQRQLNYLMNLKIRFQVTLPRQYNVDLKTLQGNISIDDLAGEVQAQTSAGNIHIDNVVGAVRAHTSAGNLRLNGINGAIFGRSSAGNITIANCLGEVDAKTSAGNIRADLATQPQHEWNLQTSAGNITGTLSANIAVAIDARTSVGNLSTDFRVQGTVTRNKLRGTINGGGQLLKLRTSAGNIRLQRK